MKKFEKKQVWIGLSAAVLLAAFALLLYRPLHGKIQQLRAQKNQEVAAEQQALFKQAKLGDLKKQLEGIKGEIGNFEHRIPSEGQLGKLLHDIAEAMNRNNLRNQLVAPEAEAGADKLMRIPVRMQCTGSMKQIFDFFRAVESLERIIRIEQVQFKNTAELTGAVSMHAVANVYYQAQSRDK